MPLPDINVYDLLILQSEQKCYITIIFHQKLDTLFFHIQQCSEIIWTKEESTLSLAKDSFLSETFFYLSTHQFYLIFFVQKHISQYNISVQLSKTFFYIPLSSDISNVFFKIYINYLFETAIVNYTTRVMLLTHPTKNDRFFLI